MRNFRPGKMLFLVHREQILKQAAESFRDVLGSNINAGILSGNSQDYDADYLFSTVQTMSKTETMHRYRPDYFDYIIIDDERVIIRTKLEKPSKIKGLALI